MHERAGRGSIFATLTYAPEHVPADGSLSKDALQLFHHRMRKALGPFRYLAVGEYGGRFLRPHFHAIYFGLDFRADRYPWRRRPHGMLYRSPTLERLWPFGQVEFSDFARECAGYLSRYALKKQGVERDREYYRREAVDPVTGELRTWFVEPEFKLVSRRPGLGSAWFDAFKDDCFPADFVVVDGRRFPVPRYYFNKLSPEEQEAVLVARREDKFRRDHTYRGVDDAELASMTREEREARGDWRGRLGRAYAADNSDARLLVKHESQALRAARLVRQLDDEL